MASFQSVSPPPISKDLDDLVDSIFTKYKNSTSTDSEFLELRQWWDCLKNDGEVTFILQSGINSIMSGAYALAMKRVYDTASRKKQVSAEKSTTKAYSVSSNHVAAYAGTSSSRFDEKNFHENKRNHSESVRYQHCQNFGVSGLKTMLSFPRHGPNYQHHEQRDSVSRELSRSVESSHRYDSHEDRNGSNVYFFRNSTARNDVDISVAYYERHHGHERLVRRDAESSSVYNRHRDSSEQLTETYSYGDDRSYRGDHVSRRQEGLADHYKGSDSIRHDHNGRSKNYETRRLMDLDDCDDLCYDRPRHSGSSQTSSQLKPYRYDNGSVHRSSLSTNRSNRHGTHENRESIADKRKNGTNNHEHYRRHHTSDRSRAQDRADRTMGVNSKDCRYDAKSENDGLPPIAPIPSVAIVKSELADQKSLKMNRKRECNVHSSPRSRKSRKSKRHRRSSNHDSSSSVSDSSFSSRGSSRRHHRHHSGSSNRRRHSRHGEIDEESLSSSTYRHSRRKRKSTRRRHRKSDADGILDNRKSDFDLDRDIENQKDYPQSNLSPKKRNPHDHEKGS
jgi:hypothetical protein